MTITLRRNAHLTAKERVDTLRALLLWNEKDIIPGLVGMEGINLIEQSISPAAQPTGRTEVMEQNLLHLVGLHVGITHDTAVGCRHVNQRNLITGADARHGFQPDIDTQFLARLLDGGIHLGGSAGLATVLHSQAHFTLRALLSPFSNFHFFLGHHPFKVIEHITHPSRLHMAEYLLINLYHGSQGATAQARHLLDGILSIGSRDVVALQLQFAPEGIINVIGALHMTRRSNAHLDNVFAVGHHPQLRVERSYTDELGTVDLRPLVQTVERLRRQVVELLLYGLQQRDDLLPLCAYAVDHGIRLQIHLTVFHLSSFLHNKEICPCAPASYRP